MDYPIYIFSDLHLEHPLCDTAGIDRALDRCEAEGGKIVCAGDLVDLWYASRGRINAEQMERLRRIQMLLFVNVAGNHDSPTVQDPILIPTHYPRFQMLIDHRIWYIEHGHLIGRYGWLFKILDGWDEKVLFRKIARAIVRTEMLARAGSAKYDYAYVEAALGRCKLKGGTVAIFGHNHYPEIYRDVTGEREVTYVNPGSALKKSKDAQRGLTYAIYKNGNFTLEGTR